MDKEKIEELVIEMAMCRDVLKQEVDFLDSAVKQLFKDLGLKSEKK